MIIGLSVSFQEDKMLLIIKNCEPNSYEHDPVKMGALINLLNSHGLRNNIVLAPKDALKEIIESPLYSKNDKIYASDILDVSREYGALKNSLLMYGVVDFNGTSTSVVCTDDRYEITISYNNFINPINAEATPIITENNADFTFYSVIGKFYSKFISKLNLNLKLSHHLGAGSHSKPQFDRLSNYHPFLLCIVDNDKAHPNKGEGSTSSVFISSDRMLNNGKLAKILNVREIESLIPKLILDKVFNYDTSSIIDNLNEIYQLALNNEDFRVYFDHKDGISLKQAIELDNRYGEFWLPILSNINRFNTKDCFISKICTECNDCPRLNGLGDSLLKNSNIHLVKTNPHRFKNSLESNIKDLWEDVGYFMLTWGCVPSERLTRS